MTSKTLPTLLKKHSTSPITAEFSITISTLSGSIKESKKENHHDYFITWKRSNRDHGDTPVVRYAKGKWRFDHELNFKCNFHSSYKNEKKKIVFTLHRPEKDKGLSKFALNLDDYLTVMNEEVDGKLKILGKSHLNLKLVVTSKILKVGNQFVQGNEKSGYYLEGHSEEDLEVTEVDWSDTSMLTYDVSTDPEELKIEVVKDSGYHGREDKDSALEERILALETELEGITNSKNDYKKSYAKKRAEVEEIQKSLQEMNIQIEDKDTELIQLQEKLGEKKSEVETLKEKLESQNGALAELSNVEENLIKLQVSIEEKDAEISTLRDEKDEEISQLTNLTNEKDSEIQLIQQTIIEKEEIIRTNDIVLSEKENTITSLNSQIEEIEASTKADIDSKSQEILSLQGEVTSLNDQIKELEGLRVQLSTKDEEIEHLNNIVSEKDDLIKELGNQSENGSTELIAKFESQISERDEEIKSLQAENESKDTEITERDEEIKSLQTDTESKDTEISELKENITVLEEKTNSIPDLESQISERDEEIKSLQTDIESKDNEISELKENITVLEEKTNQNPELDQAIEENAKLIEEINKKHEAVLAHKDAEIHNQNELNEKNESALSDLREELSLLQEKANSVLELEKTIEERDTEIATIKTEITEKDVIISTLREEESNHQKEIKHLNNIVSEKDDLIKELGNQSENGSTELIAKFESQISERDEEIKSLQAENESKDNEISERDEEIKSLQAEKESKDTEITERDEEIKSLQTDIESKDTEITERDEEIKLLQAENESKDTEISELKENITVLQDLKITKDNEIAKLENQLSETITNNENENDTVMQLQEQVLSLSTSITEKENHIEKLNKEISLAENVQVLFQTDISKKDEEINHLKNVVSEKDELIKDLGSQSENGTEIIAKFESQISERDEEIKSLQADIESKDTEISELKENITVLEESAINIPELENDAKQSQIIIENLKKEIETLESSFNLQSTEKEAELVNLISSKSADIEKLQELNTTLQDNMTTLQKTIEENEIEAAGKNSIILELESQSEMINKQLKKKDIEILHQKNQIEANETEITTLKSDMHKQIENNYESHTMNNEVKDNFACLSDNIMRMSHLAPQFENEQFIDHRIVELIAIILAEKENFFLLRMISAIMKKTCLDISGLESISFWMKQIIHLKDAISDQQKGIVYGKGLYDDVFSVSTVDSFKSFVEVLQNDIFVCFSNYVEQICEKTLPLIKDYTFSKSKSVKRSLSKVIEHLSKAIATLKQFGHGEDMYSAIMMQVFHQYDTELFNILIQNNQYCTVQTGFTIKQNLSILIDWAQSNSVLDACLNNEMPYIINTANVLIMEKQIFADPDLLGVVEPLEPSHIYHLLKNFIPEQGQEGVPKQVLEVLQELSDKDDLTLDIKSINTMLL